MSYLNSGGLVHLFETCNYCSNFNFDEINSDEEKKDKNTLISIRIQRQERFKKIIRNFKAFNIIHGFPFQT